MREKLSGYTIVIIFAGGLLTFIILFIFAKRQIMRFALRSRRGPHIPVGHDAKKSLKREIERRLDIILKISCEPKLIHDSKYILGSTGHKLSINYYRMKAVDDVKILETEIIKHDPLLKRHPSENLRAYLLTTLAAPLNGSGQRLIHQFCDLYEHARHDPSEFAEEEYQTFARIYLKLIDAAKLLKSFNRRGPASRNTPQKTTSYYYEKNRSLLDPSRLKPPAPPPPPTQITTQATITGEKTHRRLPIPLATSEEDILTATINNETNPICETNPAVTQLISKISTSSTLGDNKNETCV